MKLFASLSKRSVDPVGTQRKSRLIGDGPGVIGDLSGRLIRLFRLTPYALLLTLCFAPSLYAQWGSDVRLTANDSSSIIYWANHRSTGAGGNVAHVVWSDTRDRKCEVYYKRSTDEGVTWGSDVRLTADDDTVSQYPSLAVSGSNVHAVWQDYRKGLEIYYKSSTDGGATWGDDVLLTADDDTGSYWPCIVALGCSTLHVVWVDDRTPYRGVYYKRSLNGGTSWSKDVRLSSNAANSRSSPVVAASGSEAYLAWVEWGPSYYHVHFRRSTNGGETWAAETTLVNSIEGYPDLVASGSVVHLVYSGYYSPRYRVHYMRSTDSGVAWGGPWVIYSNSSGNDQDEPSLAASGSYVHLSWEESNGEVYYGRSPDDGTTWEKSVRLTNSSGASEYPSMAVLGEMLHVAWQDWRDGNREIYYKRNPKGATSFSGYLSEPSQGRHLVRDPSRGGVLHLVMQSQDSMVYYSRSKDDGQTWSALRCLSSGSKGIYPTIGLAMLPQDVYPPYLAVCAAWRRPSSPPRLVYAWNDSVEDPGAGPWVDPSYISGDEDPGAPSLTTIGTQVYVAYRAGSSPNRLLVCQNFPYDRGSASDLDTIVNHDSAEQPCLSVDGNGYLHGAWKMADSILYAPCASGTWSPKTRLDQAGSAQQPFTECYGDSVYVVWSEGSGASSEIWRGGKKLSLPGWDRTNVSQSSGILSESPTQSCAEFVTWAEDTASPGKEDIYYWRANGNKAPVEANSSTWSFWPHSQMAYIEDWLGTVPHLWSAWTESPDANQPPYTVLTKHIQWGWGGGGGGEGGGFLAEPADYGVYYKVSAGQDVPSPYCKKRDGVKVFGDKAVDFAQDSLVYELPYLDPLYDYYLRVTSYRETGSDWTQALCVNGKTVRSVQFAPGEVGAVRFKVPPEAYRRDRKAVFALKNLRGDYVTALGLTLYQRDPRRDGKGGPQLGDPSVGPFKEVFAVYPNPVTVQAQIEYSLRSPGRVDLSVYDVSGRLVRKVVDGVQPAGLHKTSWKGCNQDGRRSASGVYFVRLSTAERAKTLKFVVVR